MGKTFAEKILARAVGREVRPNEIVFVQPDWCICPESAYAVAENFQKMGVARVFDPDRLVISYDHVIPAPTTEYATAQKGLREFAKAQGIRNFYDIHDKGGISHQIMCMEGFAAPGTIVVGNDSHTCTSGAMSAFAVAVGRTELASVWALGELWLKVPESLKITVQGKFPRGVFAKDLILNIIGDLSTRGADYMSVEFHGDTILDMSVAERITLCNMGIEMGAKNAACPPDEKVCAIVREKGRNRDWAPVWADEDAVYAKTHECDVSTLEPGLACPHRVDNYAKVTELLGKPVHQVFIGSCVNGRMEDLRVAANMLRGKRVAIRSIVVPASVDIYLQACRENVIQDLVEAGCTVLSPGCGPCFGAAGGVLADGEVCLATSNRNFRGRMGTQKSELYLCSPATAAAAALSGQISDPRDFEGVEA